MTAKLVRFVRPAAAVTAVLLVAGLVQAAPAAAAPSEEWDAAISITAKVVYPPDDEDPGPPGDSIDAPADAGPAPGTLRVSIVIANVGTEPLNYLNVITPDVTNGRRDSFACAPITDNPEPPLGDPELTLYQGQSLTCTETISGIVDGTTHENSTTVLASGMFTGTRLEKTAHVWAEAGPAAPPPPPLPAASVGHLVYVDTDRDGTWDEGEPGVPGARLSIKGPDGRPVPDYETGQGVVGPQTTDEKGIYHFRHLEPGLRYTVTLDMTSPALANLTPSSYNDGAWEPDTSTWYLYTGKSVATYDSINFGLVPKNRLAISIDAPTTAVAGATINVKGHAYLADVPGQWWDFPAVLEFRAGGTTTWTKVADANSSYRGDRHVWVKVTRSGWFRYRSPGNIYTTAAVSREDHVLVTRAPVALTAIAPATVRPGTALTVAGTITRAGAPFQTGRTTLEYAPDARTWTTVADVRSTDGTLTATLKPARTGSYRYRYAGDSRTDPGTSPVRQVVVSPVVKGSPARVAPR